MGWNDDLNKINSSLMDFFFPRKCPFCGKTTGKQLLCDTCRDTLPRCERVRYGADFGRCAASLYYEGAVRQAILDFKFKGKLGAMDCFGRMMAETAAEVYSGEFDAVTWVPVSKKRLRKRGFDQARFLTGSMCVDWHVMPLETLRKVRDNPPQSGIDDPAERSGQRAGRLRGGIAGAVRRKAFAAGGRYLHHRRHTGRVRPCLEGGRRGGRDVPDIGHGAGVKR